MKPSDKPSRRMDGLLGISGLSVISRQNVAFGFDVAIIQQLYNLANRNNVLQ